MNEFPSIEALALALGLGAIALMFAFTLIAGAPPVPTLAVVRRAMLRLLPRRLPAPAGAGSPPRSPVPIPSTR
jgi:hypothetical protein